MALPSEVFKTRVREAREHRGLSQRQIVSLLEDQGIKIHQPSYSYIESGKRAVSLDEAVTIARVLDVPLDRLYLSWNDLLEGLN